MNESESRMKIEEFRKMNPVQFGKGRKRIVNWEVMRKQLLGIVFDKEDFSSAVKAQFPEKTKVSYSEMYRVLRQWSKKKNRLEIRVNKQGRVYYLLEAKNEGEKHGKF